MLSAAPEIFVKTRGMSEIILYRRKVLFAHATYRAYPVGGYILERRPRCYSVVWVYDCRIIYPVAYFTSVFHVFQVLWLIPRSQKPIEPALKFQQLFKENVAQVFGI